MEDRRDMIKKIKRRLSEFDDKKLQLESIMNRNPKKTQIVTEAINKINREIQLLEAKLEKIRNGSPNLRVSEDVRNNEIIQEVLEELRAARNQRNHDRIRGLMEELREELITLHSKNEEWKYATDYQITRARDALLVDVGIVQRPPLSRPASPQPPNNNMEIDGGGKRKSHRRVSKTCRKTKRKCRR